MFRCRARHALIAVLLLAIPMVSDAQRRPFNRANAQRLSLNRLNTEVNQLQAENQALQSELDALQSQIDSIVEPIVVVDAAGKILGPAFHIGGDDGESWEGWRLWYRGLVRPAALLLVEGGGILGSYYLGGGLYFASPDCTGQAYADHVEGYFGDTPGWDSLTVVAANKIWGMKMPLVPLGIAASTTFASEFDVRSGTCINSTGEGLGRFLQPFEELGPLPEFTPPLRVE